MTSLTQDVVDGYTKAWMAGDMQAARSYLADDLEFRGSIDQFDRADEFIAQLARFHMMLSNVDMLERFYDGTRAALLYDCVTATPAGTIRTAEFFRVTDGKVREIRLVFDAT
ncbi:MAG: nuclear transport factor 2 family protein, partial [Myxococcota bacterium]